MYRDARKRKITLSAVCRTMLCRKKKKKKNKQCVLIIDTCDNCPTEMNRRGKLNKEE